MPVTRFPHPTRLTVRRSALLGALAAAVCTAVVPAGSASAASVPAPVSFDNLQEVVISLTYNDVPPAGPSVGDTGTYVDDLYTADGTEIGVVTGTADILYQDPASGDLYSLYNQSITLPGGTIHAEGLVNVDDEIAGDWVTVPAWGTGGKYRGLIGTRSWQAVSHTLANASIDLY
jgi:hypothetical protein